MKPKRAPLRLGQAGNVCLLSWFDPGKTERGADGDRDQIGEEVERDRRHAAQA